MRRLPGHGQLAVVDPVENKTYEITIPTRDDPRKVARASRRPRCRRTSGACSHLWGVENPADPHNPMMDRKGRVWTTSKIREDEPAWCKEGSKNKFAQYYPLHVQ